MIHTSLMNIMPFTNRMKQCVQPFVGHDYTVAVVGTHKLWPTHASHLLTAFHFYCSWAVSVIVDMLFVYASVSVLVCCVYVHIHIHWCKSCRRRATVPDIPQNITDGNPTSKFLNSSAYHSMQEKVDALKVLGADVRPVPAVPFENPDNYNHQVSELGQ